MNYRSYLRVPGPPISANRSVRFNKSQRRRGLTFTEVVVAATLVVSMIGFVAPLTARIGRVWQSTRQYRLAFNELANQMELLTSLSGSGCEQALTKLKPSETAAKSLPEARLAGQLVRDEDGTRLILSINWDRGSESVPVSLVGWLDTDSVEPLDDGQMKPYQSNPLSERGTVPRLRSGLRYCDLPLALQLCKTEVIGEQP